MRKIFILILTISLLGAACGGSGGDSGIVDSFPKGPVTLEVWRPFNEEYAYQQAAVSYRDLHPNVKIKYRFIEPARFETEVINALANNKGPDIISLDHDRIPAFTDKLVEMPAAFFGSSSLLASISGRYAPAVTTDAIVDGKVYGIPFSTDSLVLYWNQDLTRQLFSDYIKSGRTFREDFLLRPPADWDEVVEAVKLITKRSGDNIEQSGIALGISRNIPRTPDIIAAMMLQRGVQMVTPDHRGANYHVAAVDNPDFYPGAAVLEYLKGFVDPASDHYTWNADMPNALDAFVDGKVAMMINSRSVFDVIEQRNPTLDFRVSPLPQLVNARTIVDYADYPIEAVTNNADFPTVAWDFLRHVTDVSLSLYTINADRTDPIRTQLATTTVLQRTNIGSGTFALQVPTAQSWFKGKEADRTDAILAETLDRVSLQGQSARDSLNQAAAALTAFLSAP